MNINWKAIGAAVVTLGGLASDPHILAILSPHAAAIVTAAGVVLQAITGPVHKADPAS